MTTTENPSRRSPLKARIRWARENSISKSNPGHISQERFAGLIGTSRRHLMRIENGTHTPRAALLAQIAEATGHDPAYFTADSDDEEDDPVAIFLADLLLPHLQKRGYVMVDRRKVPR